MRRKVLALLLVTVAATVPVCLVQAQQCVSSRSNNLLVYDDATLVPSGFPTGSKAVENAIAAWNSATCNSTGYAFPTFQLEPGGTRSLSVKYNAGLSPVANTCGSFGGSTINVYMQFRDSATGITYPCPPGESGAAQTIMHELGHVLGLGDVSASSCSGYIMSTIRYNPSTGTYAPRSVQQAECARADAINDTPMEADPLPPPDPTDPTVCHNCSQPGPEPLILDMNGDGIALSGIEDPVMFDVDGDGIIDVTSWTAPGSDDAFLVLDDDGDGFVDGGRELFGSATASHSFEALSKLDWPEYGGNEDGVIDHHDREWHNLRLWTDRDHDGTSARTGELQTLASAGIKRLELAYVQINAPDTHGNSVDYRGTFVRRAGGSEVFNDMYGVTFAVK